MSRNPSSILYDGYGNPVATLDGYYLTSISPGYPIMGIKPDDTATFLNVSDDGYIQTKTEITEPLPSGENVLGHVIIDPGAPAEGTYSALIDGDVISGGPNLIPIRDTIYIEPLSGAQRSVASSSINDNSTGTGARSIRITYYNNALSARFTEDIILAGTTGVNTIDTDIRFIEKIEVLTVGSGGKNAGIITLYSDINKGGTVIGTIAIGRNRTFWAHHYTVTGKTLYLASMVGGVKTKETGRLLGKAFNPLIPNNVSQQVTPSFVLAASTAANSLVINFAVPIAIIEGPSRFTLWIDASNNDTYYGGFALTEV